MRKALDVADLRERLKAAGNRGFWRSLDEIAQTDAFRVMLDREFPQGASEMRDPVSRRNFLKLMGASLALGGLTGCQFDFKQPQEKLVPYVRQPEQIIPGRPLQYATAMTRGGYALGLLVTSYEGRPTKIEGNLDQSASFGATDLFAQAAILNMYDPDRSTGVVQGTTASDYNAFLNAARPAFADATAAGGRGLRILTGTITSPTLADQIQSILVQSTDAVWYQYEPLGYENTAAGAQLAFGEAVDTVYAFNAADVVVALDSDFMSDPAAGVRYSRDLAEKRTVTKNNKVMSRFFVAEPAPTNTGLLADHRLSVKPSQVSGIAAQLAAALGVPGINAVQGGDEKVVNWVAAATTDLRAATGRSVVVVGESQPPAVHALVHAINATLGNVGRTVTYIDPVAPTEFVGTAGLIELVNDINAGEVSTLLMFGVNPVYDAPADLGFAAALGKVALSVHHGLYQDETAAAATWHVPAAHFLESWGDLRAFDGSVALMQPLIAPLYGGKTATEVIAGVAGGVQTDYDMLSEFWRGRPEVTTFETFFPAALNLGIVRDSAFPARQPTLAAVTLADAPVAEGIEIVFRADASLGAESEYGNNRWLHEVPKPFSKLVWDNVASVAPRTAETLALADGDIVTLTLDGRTVNAPAHVQPGMAEDVVVVTFGYGRTRAGQAGNGVGYSAFALRSSANRWFAGGLQVTKTGTTTKLASTQGHFSMEGREHDIMRHGTLEEFKTNEDFVHEKDHKIISLFPEYKYNGYKWGMSINSTVCNGCNACIVACQAENNIPIVGKAEILAGREMHWLRIDQYYEGDLDDPTVYNVVMLCQQCENAPCEIVCPVAATVHDNEGLNNMVYNRCVGTKYCSNNCPYKVRRFNFFQYADQTTPSLKLQRNPEVTVRVKGVMEKCTFCVQRISTARIDSERENRTLADGEVQTACQQACPTQAIVFGDLNNPNAQVVARAADPLTFSSLEVLNTAPRVTYMAKMTNPNPELGEHGSGHSA